MGADESVHSRYCAPVDIDVMPAQYMSMQHQSLYDPRGVMKPFISMTQLHTSPFAAKWSLAAPNSKRSPESRAGMFTVTDDVNQKMYIGFGSSKKGFEFSDLWSLDLVSYEWKMIQLLPICEDQQQAAGLISPRSGARGTLIGDKIFLYGGFSNNAYLDSFITIDVTNGKVEQVITKGTGPGPRSTPLIAHHNGKITIWGGYNGNWLTDIHLLDLETMIWGTIPTTEKGRTSIPSVVHDGVLYAHGGSHTPGIFTLDLNQSTVEVLSCTGFAPPADMMSAGMVRVEHFAFYFGGKSNDNDYTVLYCLDLKRRWWFIFHVLPDGETVSINDGSISENGIFMLPRINTFSVAYSKVNRTIVATLGLPYNDPPPLFLLNIGDAMSFIHLREDMLGMIQ